MAIADVQLLVAQARMEADNPAYKVRFTSAYIWQQLPTLK